MSHDAARRFAYAFLLALAALSVVRWHPPAADAGRLAAQPHRCPAAG